MTIKKKIQLKRATAAEWATLNPVLSAGEIGVDLTNHKLKVGDGTTAYNSLPYVEGEIDLSNYYTKSQTYSKGEVESLLAGKVDVEDLATVATTGDYDDLSNKPVIPDVSTLATKTELADGLAEKEDAFSVENPLNMGLLTYSENLQIAGSTISKITDNGTVIPYETFIYAFTFGEATLDGICDAGYIDVPINLDSSTITVGQVDNANATIACTFGEGYGSEFKPIMGFRGDYAGNNFMLGIGDGTYTCSSSQCTFGNAQTVTNVASVGGWTISTELPVTVQLLRSSGSADIYIRWYYGNNRVGLVSFHITDTTLLDRINRINCCRQLFTEDNSFNADRVGVYNYTTPLTLEATSFGDNLISASSLINGVNALQLNIGDGLAVENGSLVNTLVDELYFKVGDTYAPEGNMYVAGAGTQGKRTILFTLSLPKRLDKINSVTISGSTYCYNNGDRYTVDFGSSDITTTIRKLGYNLLGVNVTSATQDLVTVGRDTMYITIDTNTILTFS